MRTQSHRRTISRRLASTAVYGAALVVDIKWYISKPSTAVGSLVDCRSPSATCNAFAPVTFDDSVENEPRSLIIAPFAILRVVCSIGSFELEHSQLHTSTD
jgi:hypothetical protein